MYAAKIAFVIALAVAGASARPQFFGGGYDPRPPCGNDIGSCFDNDCNGSFLHVNDTEGTCRGGNYVSCACRKCGGTYGDYIGGCKQNGCKGENQICTAGKFQGCPCDSYH
ncbi:hypothetical protein F5Y13DRAFT_189571 [Hypoxylon sp. FL1857]|nr:hypothetical protein F5Y13DRAFT_189571 [Hypoxylon sp. FL1857]